MLLDGYIQFTLPGGIESRGGSLSAASDENSVGFKKSKNNSAIALKDKIEELRRKSSLSVNQVVQVSAADEIKKFKQLLDEEIITKEEFDKKKKELLSL
ncbi:MAG: SHOCT domain-containing protein [Candidatus Shapirobacteria bacterium]|nr:SHOCT domain-containing protein [Candidatus Shapirobacteria bacterium]